MPKSTRIRNSLRYSFWDGFFASIQFGIVEQFAVPLALYMGAGSTAVGLLNFIRNVLVAIIQFFSADLTGILHSRKKLIVSSVFLAAFLWLPTFWLPFFFQRWRVAVFIILFALASAFNMLPTPAWASLMAEYIPPGKRGRYFGWRGAVLGLVYCVSVLLAGLALYLFKPINLFVGFALLLAVAALARFISWYFLNLMYEPGWRVKVTDEFSFWAFIRRIRVSNFARFSVLSALFVLSVALVSPFFAVYLLKELGFDYFTFTVIISAAVLTTHVTMRYWGRLADQYGNMKIIRLTSCLVAVIPLCWIFSGEPLYLVIVQLLAGFVWAGFNLSSTNFIYDVATANKRERCIAYYNFLTGLGLGVGALLGGFLYRHLPLLWGSSFYNLLLLSASLRLFFALAISLLTKEVKNIKTVRVRALLYDMSGLRALGLLTRELIFRQKM